MPERHKHTLNRRNVLKVTGAGLGAVGLAGCTGDSDDDGDDTAAGNGDTNGNGNGDDPEPDIDVDLSGVEFEYWNAQFSQSAAARRAAERLHASFESRTGASVEISWEGYGNIVAPTWAEAFQRGDYPVLYDSVSQFGGTFVQGDWVYPAEEYLDEFPDEIVDNIDWILDTVRHQYRDFGDDVLFEIPYGFNMFSPFIARTDHFEAAGLDPEEDFPPTNYDELIDVATTLQEDGPGTYGYQIHGDVLDITDVLIQWTLADGGANGLFLNEEVTDTIIDNDVWVENLGNYVDVFQEYGLSNPGTPASADEEVVPQLASGEISMSQIDTQNLPMLIESAPDLLDDGSIMWAPAWSGPENQRGRFTTMTYGITRPPEDADEDDWEQRQQGAMEYIKMMLSEEVQLRLFEDYGLMPVREDVWELLPDRTDNAFATQITMAQESDFGPTAHPQLPAYLYGTIPGHFQEALQGNVSAEEACQNAASDLRDQLF
ncbi:ABC transporter substrate-binding protein [Natrialbaceae archaeon A-CW2]